FYPYHSFFFGVTLTIGFCCRRRCTIGSISSVLCLQSHCSQEQEAGRNKCFNFHIFSVLRLKLFFIGQVGDFWFRGQYVICRIFLPYRFSNLPPTHWRLCEVFCILQNLLMCEVPERASDGKASSAIWREPEGISPDRFAAW